MHRTALMWFRRDLRLADNPALASAVSSAERVACVFVSPEGRDAHAPGAAALARLHRSLDDLAVSLGRSGCGLAVVRGPASDAVADAARQAEAGVVTCSRDWTPAGRAEEHAVAASLAAAGIEFRVSEGQLLAVPGSVVTAGDAPYRVFTPFYRKWLASVRVTEPEPAPSHVRPAPAGPTGRVPRRRVAGTVRPAAPSAGVGETAAHKRLAEFAIDGLASYATSHDLPGVRGTSELSAPLALGELSPRQAAWAAVDAVGDDVAAPFLRQLAWREFSYHVIAANPAALDEPLRPAFSAMPWRDDFGGLAAWAAGATGWPIVDAGMRQLAQTGWMHNRVRMVAASALTKDLLVPWQWGAAAFEGLLADYDPAANAFNWQWVAGSGADAAPYFRIFNPTLQGVRFDPEGAYVKRWVPELADLPTRYIHRPWDAPTSVLQKSGIRLGETYPHQLIGHAEARQRALAAFSAIAGRG